MNLLSGILLIFILIIVHETGHFVFAKMLGVRVITFSIGFGPKLFSFNYKKTEYRLSVIPFGGYVKMLGESPKERISEVDKFFSFSHKSIWKKSLIAFAGSFFNLIFPIILFFFITYGNQVFLAPLVGTVMSNSVAEKCGILSGDKIVEISNKEISTFSQAAEIVLENPNNKLNFLVERIVDSKIEYIKLNMIPKKYKNFHPLSKKKIIGKIGVMPVIEKPIILVPYENSLAFKYGMRDFDKIISIKRAKATSFVDIKNHLFLSKKNSFRVQRRIDGKIFKIKINSFFSKFKEEHKKAEIYFHSIMSYEKKNKKIINKIIKAKKNIFDFEKRIMLQNGIIFSGGGVVKVEDESLSKRLGILSGDKLISINNKKITSLSILEQELFYGGSNIHVISIIGNNRSKILIFRFEKKEKINLRFSITKEFGLSFASSYKQGYTFFRHVGVLESLNVALFQTFDLIKIMIKSFLALFSFKISLSQLGGPITIFDIAGQASSISLRFYFYIMAMLSVNLGLLNLLPIPVLDGGHLMFFAIEAWRKKEISIKYKEIALIIGTIFILFLMILALFNDLLRIFH